MPDDTSLWILYAIDNLEFVKFKRLSFNSDIYSFFYSPFSFMSFFPLLIIENSRDFVNFDELVYLDFLEPKVNADFES